MIGRVPRSADIGLGVRGSGYRIFMTHSTLDERRHQPTGKLVSQLSEQVSTLVRDELALARAELTEKGKRAGTGAGLLGAAGVLALYGLGALFVTAAAALALVWPVWLAVLVVAVVIFAIAGVVASTTCGPRS
jgi:hypothetical protein